MAAYKGTTIKAKNRMIQLKKEGWTLEAIALEFNVAINTIRWHTRTIPSVAKKGCPPRVDRNKLKDLDGYSAKELAERFGCRPNTINNARYEMRRAARNQPSGDSPSQPSSDCVEDAPS